MLQHYWIVLKVRHKKIHKKDKMLSTNTSESLLLETVSGKVARNYILWTVSRQIQWYQNMNSFLHCMFLHRIQLFSYHLNANSILWSDAGYEQTSVRIIAYLGPSQTNIWLDYCQNMVFSYHSMNIKWTLGVKFSSSQVWIKCLVYCSSLLVCMHNAVH